MNRVYREHFPEAPPARATVGASLTAPPYKVEMTFVASAAARQVVHGDGPVNPNLSAAVVADGALYVSGLLAGGAAASGDAATQTRDILRRLDGLLERAGASRGDVRDLLVYVTGADAGRMALAECEAGFGARPALTVVPAALASPGALVEVMATAVLP